MMKMFVCVAILLIVATAVSGQAADPADHGNGKIVILRSGLKYIDLVVGTGPEAKAGQTVRLHCTAKLKDGTLLLALDRIEPFSFRLGGGKVIKGLDEGVTGMKAGGRRRLIIPPDLAYGERGVPGVVPRNADLIFEVDLNEISG